MGRKEGLLCPFSWGSWVPVYHNVAWAEIYFRTKWHLHPSSRLATINMAENWGGASFREAAGPHLTQRRWAEAYLRTKCHRDPFNRLATIDMAENWGLRCLFGLGGWCWVPIYTKSPGLRPTFMPSAILIHPAVWPQ